MNGLAPKERLLAAGQGLVVDRAPCISPGGMMNMIVTDAMTLSGVAWPKAHSNAYEMAALTAVIAETGGFENYGVPFCLTVEAEAMGANVDMGDMDVEPHVVASPLTSATQYKQLKTIDINKGRTSVVLEAIRLLRARKTEFPIIGNLTGPISLAGTVVDMSTLLMELRKNPKDCGSLLNFIAEQLIIFGNAQVDAGADAICISEPSGTGEILGKNLFEEYTSTYLNRVLDRIDAPLKIVHICGRLRPVYVLLKDIRCDIFSIDAIVPIKEIKPYLGDKSLMGNVSAYALGSVSPDKVKQLAKTVLQQGVDILAPACGLHIATPLENIRAMVQTSRQEVLQ